uniref:Uncharacterized protein n=1 Tax=Eutreptiella gymnastica TaxID=73025 RepID=A0A7S4CZ03_9EUGL
MVTPNTVLPGNVVMQLSGHQQVMPQTMKLLPVRVLRGMAAMPGVACISEVRTVRVRALTNIMGTTSALYAHRVQIAIVQPKRTAQHFFRLLPPIHCTAPSGERKHDHATVRNGLTCQWIRGVGKHPSNFRCSASAPSPEFC